MPLPSRAVPFPIVTLNIDSFRIGTFNSSTSRWWIKLWSLCCQSKLSHFAPLPCLSAPLFPSLKILEQIKASPQAPSVPLSNSTPPPRFLRRRSLSPLPSQPAARFPLLRSWWIASVLGYPAPYTGDRASIVCYSGNKVLYWVVP